MTLLSRRLPMKALVLLLFACSTAEGYSRSIRDRREENYLGSGKKKDKPTIKDHMISTALHIFTPDINGSAIATFSIEKVEYHLSKESSTSKESYDVECDPVELVVDSSLVACKERIRCARNFSSLGLEDVPTLYTKRKLSVLNWFCNKGEHCCELECCTYKRNTGLMFGLIVLGAVLTIGLILFLVRLLENMRENRRMEAYVKQVQAVYRSNGGGQVDIAT